MFVVLLLAVALQSPAASPSPVPPAGIDESGILSSPLAADYTRWRDEFLSVPAGRHAWSELQRRQGFTLRMRMMDAPWDGQWATVVRHYDAGGNYVAADVRFSPLFGRSDPRRTVLYPFAAVIAREQLRSGRQLARAVYAFAHEMAHVLWGFDQTPATALPGGPTHADLAREFDEFVTHQLRVAEEYHALSHLRRDTLTAVQSDRFAWLAREDDRLRRVEAGRWRLLSENYGDAFGYELYRVWAAGRPDRAGPGPAGLLGSR